MSCYWKPLLRDVLEAPHKYSDIIGNLYSLVLDYRSQDCSICSISQLDDLARAVCEIEPLWSLDCIPGTKRCFRCRNVFIDEDIREIRIREERSCVKEFACEDCADRVEKMGHLIPDDEKSDLSSEAEEDEANASDAETDYLNNAEFEDEIARGR